MNLDNRTLVLKRLLDTITYIETHCDTPDMEIVKKTLVITASEVLNLFANSYQAEAAQPEITQSPEEVQSIIEDIRRKL